MAIQSKTFSIVSCEKKDIDLDGFDELKDVITQVNWKIIYTDTNSKTVEVEGSTAFDGYHLARNENNPRTGSKTTFKPFTELTDEIIVKWIEDLYENDESTKIFFDYKANYLLTGEDPNGSFTINPPEEGG